MLHSSATRSVILLGLLLCGQSPAGAQGLPVPNTAVGHSADVAVTPSGFEIRFAANAEWPNVLWTAPAAHPWDWRSHAVLAFDAVNPGTEPINFSVRIDDDPSADGVLHCRTVGTTLSPHTSGAFCIGLDSRDPMTALGMRGVPPPSGTSSLSFLSGSGSVDPTHIVAFQFFMHQPTTARMLRLSHLRLLPSRPISERFSGIVDAFGQFTGEDWPGKVHTISDFAHVRDTEAKALTAAPALPDRDAYGGWAAGPKLPNQGYFSTTKRNDRWWLVTPTGHLFLSFGLDTVTDASPTIVHPRDTLFTDLPAPDSPLAKDYGTDDHVLYGPYKSGRTFDFYAANLERKYGSDYSAAWRDRTLARLQSWGFNTIGNWSDEDLETAAKVPYTATLSVDGNHARLASGSDYWGRMHDPFDLRFAADCDASFRDKAMRLKDDPWCLGYFVDNELSWNGGQVDGGRYGLAYGALAAQSAQPAKQAFLALLQARYGSIGSFNQSWGTTFSDWRALDPPYQASQTPTETEKRDMGAFVYALAQRYFTVVSEALRKYDPHHLYLGCRFAEGAPVEAVKAGSEICDVVSFNVYRPRLDKADLQKNWGWAASLDKPCLIGEFQFGALDRGLFHPGLVPAASQTERAVMFRQYIDSVIDNPMFVGAHWFQYGDEPLTGRSLDGENYNIGFVSVTDTPYPEMVKAAQTVLATAYARHATAETPHPRQARTP